MQDGGCDAEVRSESAQDPEHHLDAPTVWQFKATEAKFSDQQLEKEINKAHAKKRILEGYRFVFSIAADMAADKVSEWEEVLNAQRKLINSAAPPVRVYAADRLARWCSRYPGLVLNYRGIDGFQSDRRPGEKASPRRPGFTFPRRPGRVPADTPRSTWISGRPPSTPAS